MFENRRRCDSTGLGAETRKARKMSSKMASLVWLAAVAAVGCATPYQQSSFRGGYSDTRIDSNTVMVSFKGNGFTGRQTVESYLLYRCAQLTLNDGYDYFVLASENTESKHGSSSTPSTFTSTTSASAIATGNSAYGQAQTFGTLNPGHTFTHTKYGGEAVIKMFKGKKPADDPRAYDAHEVKQYLGPQIGASPSS
jgi:hypothetical protein